MEWLEIGTLHLFWLLAHKSCDLSQTETKITFYIGFIIWTLQLTFREMWSFRTEPL